MNTFVADPHWHGWIIWYFFLGGMAAGSYFVAALADLVGSAQDRQAARAGYLIAAPLIAICGVLLIADLSQPLRFWHMMLDHDTWRPHLKFWSPMSIGAWAILVFSLVSTISFVGALAEAGSCGLARYSALAVRLHHGWLGRGFDVLGTACGFFVASYTGVLLTATNQPVWSDSPWIGGLFLASSASTGLAAIQLLLLCQARRNAEGPDGHGGLSRIEVGAWILESLMIALLLASLGAAALRTLIQLGLWLPFLVGVVGLGIVLPALLRLWPRTLGRATLAVSAVSVLVGGFLLRYSVVTAPTLVLRHSVETARFTPPHEAADVDRN